MTAVKAGIEVCFANAGTTELPLVRALEKVPEYGRFCACLKEDAAARPMDTPG
jgi:acetolactate synthase-1/2/3 large subunit